MQFQIPTKEGKLWISPNKSDTFGNIFATFNMDFDSWLGKARVAIKTIIRTDSTDDANLGLPMAFVRTSADVTDRWWALCGAVLFKNTAGTNPVSSNFVQDAIVGGAGTDDDSPADLTATSSDMVEFNEWLVVSRSNNLARLVAGTWKRTWWTDTVANGGLIQAELTASIAHPLHVSLKTNLLLIGDGNFLHTVDKNSNVKNQRVILSSEFEIIWIRSTYDGTWIGARNKTSKEAKAFFWDEYAENYNRGYELKSDMTFAGVVKSGIIYTVNGEGQLLYFNGSGFEEVAVFPFFRQNRKLDDGNTVCRSICRNGMTVIEGKIHINVGWLNQGTLVYILESFPCGIWTYDEKQGLRHKYAFTLYRSATGTQLDYGAFEIPAAGALVSIFTNNDVANGSFLAGATIGSDATTNINGIFYRTASILTRGHFITSIFESSAFEDVFKNILLTFKRFKNSGDRIIIKYRTIKNPNYPATGMGTFTSTSVFTSPGDLSNVVAGDEVMIVRGRGTGGTYKISTITFSTPTYTVTLSEAITNASGTMLFHIRDWKEAATISTQGIERQSFDLDAVGTFIQLKIELRSEPSSYLNIDSPELEKIVVTSKAEILE